MMRVTIDLYEIGCFVVEASGHYNPDIMDDITTRANSAARDSMNALVDRGVAIDKADNGEAAE